jgi:serine/threonine protein kinase
LLHKDGRILVNKIVLLKLQSCFINFNLAIKKLFGYTPDMIDEVGIHQNLKKHINVVQLYSSYLDNDKNLYIILELCESDLQKYLDGDDNRILVNFYSGRIFILLIFINI